MTQYLMTTNGLEIEALLPLIAFEYVAMGPFYIHLSTILAAGLTSAVFLKSAQTFFYP